MPDKSISSYSIQLIVIVLLNIEYLLKRILMNILEHLDSYFTLCLPLSFLIESLLSNWRSIHLHLFTSNYLSLHFIPFLSTFSIIISEPFLVIFLHLILIFLIIRGLLPLTSIIERYVRMLQRISNEVRPQIRLVRNAFLRLCFLAFMTKLLLDKHWETTRKVCYALTKGINPSFANDTS